MKEAHLRFRDVYDQLASPARIAPETVHQVFRAILDGQWNPVQVAGFLVALRMAGETAETIAAAAAAMRDAMVAVEHGLDRVLDTCGTGGDGKGTLNLSTGAAIIAASSGVPVAKHGNRAVSSRAGSADVVEALQVPLDVAPELAEEVLRDAGIAFLMAPAHHPAMRHAAAARQQLGIRTIFNCLGPLANPARATHQLLGAYDDALRPVLAETLRSLGTKRAWVVRGADGLDEVSPFGPTYVTELSNETISELVVTPESFGIDRSPAGSVDGGDAEHNARVLEAVLKGDSHPAADAFVLNAAAALVVAEELEPEEATRRSRTAIQSGASLATLQRWREATRSRRQLPDA